MYKINGVFECEQPVYRLQRNGAESLPDEELLALVLRIPQRNGLDVLPKLRSFLRKNPLEKLADFDLEHPPGQIIDRRLKGNDLTPAQQITLQAVLEFSRRVLDRGMGIDKPITSPADVLPEVRHIRDAKKEHFVAIFLNARNVPIKTETISVGSLNASIVHMRELFAPALATSACSLICIHNHPSGDTCPSREDIELTRRIVQAGEIMGIEVLDHLIVGSDRFLSMKEANVF
ncbi:MAG: DNA repair protein RadC [Gemmatimonadetes bacterium]|nr:DNA repair protein RadC [Gemmatimonadota bacterium]MYK51694.1 DNA repair protein RadC [Gemmatimonadota bacterium]